uniref:Protein-tyrosine-phosphatase MKP1 n=1 Tax=Kalanchoe fedtschenkoi TaxID=63787 RepID=A0A7N0TF03_KALFE
MLGEDDKDKAPGGTPRKGYLRSVSWSDRSPSKPFSRPQGSGNNGSKPRSCLPPLQPLSISRRSVEEWPRAGSDDLGVWPNPPTPGGKRVSIKPLEIPDGEQHAQREFLFNKDKLAFFDKDCSRIAEHIYLGSAAVAKNWEILKKNGITHVLNCAGFVCPEYFKNDLVYKTLWLQDSPSEDITSILYDVFDYFEDVREQKGRVLVHCYQGVSRSTSLVIAYIMWRDGQSFEDAFQYVKAARGVTNPNMGFACQLLQCQKRVHAVPVSPNSALRVFRMAPHSPYAPLHLVPKMLSHPGAAGLDSRGAFIVHVPTSLYVWVGKKCDPVMSNSAKAAAFQVVRYERAEGPIVIIREGEEPAGFWDALGGGRDLGDSGEQMNVEKEGISSEGEAAARLGAGGRRVDKYDTDFEIFFKALDGGVVPPFPLSGAVSETHLPARGNGWGRLRQKFTSGIMKGFLKSSKVKSESFESEHGSDMIIDTLPGVENTLSQADPSCSLSSPCGSPGSDQSPSPGSPDSFSHFLNGSPKIGFRSPSLSPSTSDYGSSFTFSPSSSNWSDHSGLSSRQPSPSGLESSHGFSPKDGSVAGDLCIHTSNPAQAAELCANACLHCEGPPFIAERRGTHPPPMMILPSVDKPPRVPRTLVRSSSFSLPDLKIGRRPLDCSTDAQDQMLYEDSSELEDEFRSEDRTDFTRLALHQWPSLVKVEMRHFDNLDSRSVYIMSALDPALDGSDCGLIYVWLGHESSMENFPSLSDGSRTAPNDVYTGLEAIGHECISSLGLPINSTVQVVKEGEEPKHFLESLNLLTVQRKG